MTDFEELKKAKQRCVDELVEALPMYRERLNEIDHRLVEYIEDAISNNASHANIYELLDIYDHIPEGWVDISDIVTAPAGYHWINNRKSIFNKEYRHALLRI